MNGPQLLSKFPPGSSDRDYDVFEEFPDGSTVWRCCVFGMGNVELKLRELAHGSDNKFFSLSFHDRDRVAVRPSSVKQASTDQKKRSA